MPILPASFRAPDETRIGKVVIQVADLDRSLAFYTDIIGFVTLMSGENAGSRVAMLGVDAGPVLLELREKAGARAVPRQGLLGLYHFAVLVPSREDLGRLLLHLRSRRVPLGAADHLVSEALYLVDPDGLTVEVYRDRPRSEWLWRGEELAMASNPLDTDGLLAAGAGRPLAGLSSGTTIGHMHFYVDDLARAEAFYHHGLGLDRTAWTFPGALFMAAGGYHHHVAANIWAADSRAANDDDAKLMEWELVLPTARDVAAVTTSLRRGGFTVTSAPNGDVAVDDWSIAVRIVTERS